MVRPGEAPRARAFALADGQATFGRVAQIAPLFFVVWQAVLEPRLWAGVILALTALLPSVVAQWRYAGRYKGAVVTIGDGWLRLRRRHASELAARLADIQRVEEDGIAIRLAFAGTGEVELPDGDYFSPLRHALRANLPQGCLLVNRPAVFWRRGSIVTLTLGSLVAAVYGAWVYMVPVAHGWPSATGRFSWEAIGAISLAMAAPSLFSAFHLWRRNTNPRSRPVDWTLVPLTLNAHRLAGDASPWAGSDLVFRQGEHGAELTRRASAKAKWTLFVGLGGGGLGLLLLLLGHVIHGGLLALIASLVVFCASVNWQHLKANDALNGVVVRFTNGKWSAQYPGGMIVSVREGESPSKSLIASIEGSDIELDAERYQLDPPCPPPQRAS